MRTFNILGVRITLGKPQPVNVVSNEKGKKRRPSNAIKKQYKRNVSFEIDSITQALQMAESPDYPDRSRLHEIYRYVLRDGHLKGQIKNVMKPKVMSEPWVLYRNGQPDNAATELFQKRWMSEVIEYILEAELHGYSVVELDDFDPAKAEVKEVVLIPREHVSMDWQRILIDGTITGDYIEYAEVMNDLNLLEFGKRTDLGLLLECSYNVLWKYFSRSDWSRASEKFGMPILSIKAGTTNEAELDDLETRAANFGTDGYVIVQEDDEVNIIERTGQNIHLIYKDNITLCDEQISKLINGGTASSDTKAFTGSAEVQERTLEDISTMRMQLVADEMNDKVLPFLEAKGFPVKGLRFDYPALKRAREKRIIGQQITGDAKPAPGEPEPTPTPTPVA